MMMMTMMMMMMTTMIILIIMMMFTTIIAWRNGLVNCYDLLRLLILSLSLSHIYIYIHNILLWRLLLSLTIVITHSSRAQHRIYSGDWDFQAPRWGWNRSKATNMGNLKENAAEHIQYVLFQVGNPDWTTQKHVNPGYPELKILVD